MKHTIRTALILVITLLSVGAAFAQGYVLNPGTPFQTFDDTSNWQMFPDDVGTISADTSHVKQGSASLKMVAQPGSDVFAHKAINYNFANTNTVSFWIYMDAPVGWTHYYACSIYLTSDNYNSYFLAVTDDMHPGWSKVTFSKKDFVATGNPSWNTNMTSMQIGVFGNTNDGLTAYWDDMELGEYTKPKVIISFDDGWDSTYNYGYQYLKQYGMKGTAYVVSSFVNNPNRVTEAQLQEMYNYGWDMCNHTATHPDLTTLTKDQVTQEYITCANFLVAHGWTRRSCFLHAAYPFGRYSDTVEAADQAAGFITVRTTNQQRQANAIDSAYLLYTQIPEGTAETFADQKTYIDKLVASGGVLEFTFHQVVTGTPSIDTEWNDVDFRAIIDYIAQQRNLGNLDVVTLTEWYEGLKPALASVATDSSIIVGGNGVNGRVALTGPVFTAGGASVALNSDNAKIQVPSKVVVPVNAASIGFAVTTSSVSSTTVGHISAGMNGVTVTTTLTVTASSPLPVNVTGLSLGASSLASGSSTIGTVTLSGSVPGNGVTVNLSSNSSAVTIPGTVAVNPGSSTGTFTVVANSVASDTNVTLTASYGGTSATAQVLVQQTNFVLTGLAMPDSTRVGRTVTATVWISANAPAAGVVVTLSSSNSAVAQVPQFVTVAPGSHRATFKVSTRNDKRNKRIQKSVISASCGGVTQTSTLSVVR